MASACCRIDGSLSDIYQQRSQGRTARKSFFADGSVGMVLVFQASGRDVIRRGDAAISVNPCPIKKAETVRVVKIFVPRPRDERQGTAVDGSLCTNQPAARVAPPLTRTV
jgi:hypothetical protein